MTLKKVISQVKQLDDWLLGHIPLLLLLTLLILLRIPNFFEPYWYGDEGIYLTIGNALRDGQRLYAEIIDHKTPLIYYLAMIPSQMGFRLLLLGWMMVTTAFFHHLSKLFIKPKSIATITTAVFVILTSLPWFEGHIANGELFVMGFILAGSYFLSLTAFFEDFFAQKQLSKIKKSDVGKLLLAGVFFGLGILTKVPGLLDVVAFFALAWFFIIRTTFSAKGTFKKIFHTVIRLLPYMWWLGVGVLGTLLTSILYFVARGSGQAYLDFGLLYNFRYAGFWALPFTQPLLVWLFSLPGKIFLIGLTVLMLSLFSKRISSKVLFLTTWTILALVASTLSNRPYPHYFLQVLPPLILLVGVTLSDLYYWYQQVIQPTKKHVFPLGPLLASSSMVILFVSVLLLLDVGLYETRAYYQNFYKLITHQTSYEEYQNQFNYLMDDNYKAAKIINDAGTSQIFIWGTNPMLYALTHTYPTGRFTVSFHIKDFDAYEETLIDLKEAQPMFIVVMNDEKSEFPGFFEYLEEAYIPNQNFNHYSLWKRQLDAQQL